MSNPQEHFNILQFQSPTKIPEGKALTTGKELWVVHKDFQNISYFNSLNPKIISISDFKLTERDSVYWVGYVINESAIFVYATRNLIPTGFILVLDENIFDFPVPKVLSFALNSLLFHRQILEAYSPVDNCLCIISKEGFSLHDSHLRTTFSAIIPISSYCVFGSYALICSTNGITIYHFSSCTTRRTVYTSNDMPFGAPKQMVVLSDFIILLFADGNKVPQIEKISSSGTVQKFPLQIFNIDINIDNLNFSVFDNAILVTDTKKNRSALLDFQDTEKYKVVGDVFDIKKGFKCIFDDTFSLFDNEIYEIKTNYEAIAQMKISKHLIAYLFRRRNGITSAVNMLIRRLKETCTSYQMKKLVKKIAPSLTSPVTQIRFVRALQFCGILNPQLLMIGMIEFYSIIGSEMTCEVKEAVFDIFTHNSCRNALIDLFNCRPSLIKLDEEALRLLMRKCGTDMIIQPRNVDNLYEYAKVCIEFGMQKEAKKLILRVILDQNEISPDKNMLDEIEDLKEKYQKRFQSDITYWSKTTS